MRFNKPRDKRNGTPHKFFAIVPHYCEDIGIYVWLEYIYFQCLDKGTPDYEFGVIGEKEVYFKYYKNRYRNIKK